MQARKVCKPLSGAQGTYQYSAAGMRSSCAAPAWRYAAVRQTALMCRGSPASLKPVNSMSGALLWLHDFLAACIGAKAATAL